MDDIPDPGRGLIAKDSQERRSFKGSNSGRGVTGGTVGLEAAMVDSRTQVAHEVRKRLSTPGTSVLRRVARV